MQPLLCGARTRQGHPCRRAALRGRRRCRLHGGLSTGPRTAEGLERSRRSRWKHGRYSREALEARARERPMRPSTLEERQATRRRWARAGKARYASGCWRVDGAHRSVASRKRPRSPPAVSSFSRGSPSADFAAAAWRSDTTVAATGSSPIIDGVSLMWRLWPQPARRECCPQLPVPAAARNSPEPPQPLRHPPPLGPPRHSC